MQYPWYQAIYNTSDLQQEDFIPDCPIVVPPDTIKEGEKTEIEIPMKNKQQIINHWIEGADKDYKTMMDLFTTPETSIGLCSWDIWFLKNC